MDCRWGYNTWHGHSLNHNWLFWLLLVTAVLVVIYFVVQHFLKKPGKTCPNCISPVEEFYLRCPECGHELKNHCPHCNKIVESGWQFCPHCKGSLHDHSHTPPTTAGISSA